MIIFYIYLWLGFIIVVSNDGGIGFLASVLIGIFYPLLIVGGLVGWICVIFYKLCKKIYSLLPKKEIHQCDFVAASYRHTPECVKCSSIMVK